MPRIRLRVPLMATLPALDKDAGNDGHSRVTGGISNAGLPVIRWRSGNDPAGNSKEANY